MQTIYKVLCCGSNAKGQLGLNHEEDTDILECCLVSETSVKSVGCGSNHALILLENGDLYASGHKTGYFGDQKDSKTFSIVKQNVKLVDAGWDFTVTVDFKNIIQIHTEKGVIEFHITEGVISYLRTSLDSILAICSNGRVFGWGNNTKGQLLGDCAGENVKMLKEFQELKFNDIHEHESLRLVDCCLGRDYGIFLFENFTTKDHILAMRGKSDRYRIIQGLHDVLGRKQVIGVLGKNKTRFFTVNNNVLIESLKSMWSSVHVLYKKDNEIKNIHSVGNDVYGQLFVHEKDMKIGVLDVGTEHGIILSPTEDEVYCWGWGEHGNCGKQKKENKLNLLYSSDSDKVASIYGGYANTWIVVTLYTLNKK